MITFPDIDTIEPGVDPWRAERPSFALDDRAPPMARMRPVPPGRSLFDDDFDLPPAAETPEEPEVIEPTFTLAELAAEREAAYRAGEAAARAVADASQSAADRTALAAIAASLDAASGEASEMAGDSADAIARLLLDTLAALFPALCARFGSAEAQALTGAILPALRQEPRATIRLPPALIQPVTETITRADPDLLPRVDFQPDPNLSAGDIRILWRNGEAGRDAGALWAEIGDILGMTGWPCPPIPQSAIKETASVE